MKLTVPIKLVVTPAQREALLATLRRCNAAACWLGEKAFADRQASRQRLHTDYYAELRTKFELSSQMACRVIAKVIGAYRRDRSIQPRFRELGAVAYDARILSFAKDLSSVSLLALESRLKKLPVRMGDHQRTMLAGKRGESDLVFRKGKFYLYVTVDVPAAALSAPTAWLGVDLGIVNLATDNDGERFVGAQVQTVRERYAKLRRSLQRAQTKSAKRHLRKVSGREARFRSIENHRISKHLVSKAQGTGRGIALEDLKGIRDRVTVWGKQRARLHGWAFSQLRSFVAYKAERAGIPVVLVDPRNTSRTCPCCAHVAKENRKTQAGFLCVRCGRSGHADHVAAINIAARAAVNRPIVSGVEVVVSHGVQEQSPVL